MHCLGAIGAVLAEIAASFGDVLEEGFDREIQIVKRCTYMQGPFCIIPIPQFDQSQLAGLQNDESSAPT